jgi:dinuclear metal center YbgI/SA1388 family protein
MMTRIMPTVADIAADLEQFAPLHLALDWDNVGLLVGDAASPVQRILTCLTVTPFVAAEAIESNCQMIVSHHPVLFRAVKSVTASTVEGKMLLGLIRAGVAVYSPHTAFDNCAGGINDQLVARLRLSNVRPLRPVAGESKCKVVVFVPPREVETVADAIFAAGAGRIGQYRECSFRLPGTGTFFGEESARPTVGQKGRRESVEEVRLEVVCPESAIAGVVSAMRAAHSYEEPAFDVYSLKQQDSSFGQGRVGDLSTAMSLREFAEQVRTSLELQQVPFVGDMDKPVRTLAIACGSAGEHLPDAIRAGADVFLTGEMRFHGCVDAESLGIGVVLAGHYATERLGIEMLAQRLQQRWPDCTVSASRREADPIRWLERCGHP